ncbi:MAG: hypothetical protein U1E65_03920 [Myxococcota bacterium]
MSGDFPLAKIVVELMTELPDRTLALRPGAESVLGSALDALFLSGSDPMKALEPTLRLLLLLIEEKKSPEPVRILMGIILGRPEVPPLLAKVTDLDRATRAFRVRFEGSASSTKAVAPPPPGTTKATAFKGRLKG